MGYQFPNSILKIDADGNTVASDTLYPGERLVNGVTYEQIIAEGPQAGVVWPETQSVSATALSVDPTGVHTQLITPDGGVILRLSPLQLRAAEEAALAISTAPTVAPEAAPAPHEVSDSEPIADATDVPEA